jgi:hypothetical protein
MILTPIVLCGDRGLFLGYGYHLIKIIFDFMDAQTIVAIAIVLAAAAVILLSLALAREIASQRGSTLRVESAILQKTSPWWTPIAIVLTIVFFVAIAYRNLGIPVPIWIWIWIPGWAGTLYGQYRHRRGYPPPPPPQSSSRGGDDFEELTRLLNGDRAAARRLAKGAGIADRAIAQLLRRR